MIRPINATRIDAEYPELRDAKGRRVSGYAVILEYAESDVGRVVSSGGITYRGPATRFIVKTYATRDGSQFGAAFPRGKGYETSELALAGAHRALVAQGKRYAKQFGGGS